MFCAGFVNQRPLQDPAPRFTDDPPVGPGSLGLLSFPTKQMQGLGIWVWPGRSRLAVQKGRAVPPVPQEHPCGLFSSASPT